MSDPDDDLAGIDRAPRCLREPARCGAAIRDPETRSTRPLLASLEPLGPAARLAARRHDRAGLADSLARPMPLPGSRWTSSRRARRDRRACCGDDAPRSDALRPGGGAAACAREPEPPRDAARPIRAAGATVVGTDYAADPGPADAAGECAGRRAAASAAVPGRERRRVVGERRGAGAAPGRNRVCAGRAGCSRRRSAARETGHEHGHQGRHGRHRRPDQCPADVLIEGEQIAAIGQGLRATRRSTPTAPTSCPAGSTPTPTSRCPSWAPTAPRRFESGTVPRRRAGRRWSWTSCCRARPGCSTALEMWHNKSGRDQN